MPKIIFIFSAFSGLLGVGLGAFGAHALKDKLSGLGHLQTYQTAVQYQFVHTLALLVIGMLLLKFESTWLHYAAIALMVGIVVFSGSLYVLSLTGIRWLGAITPIGGVAFIIGWACLLMFALKQTF
jgi:uncharacterized membrane protein YgdD (TMEM256/DUF423 family)